MKKIMMFFAPMIFMIVGLMIMFFFESFLVDRVMDLFQLETTAPINMFNRIFLYLLAAIMIYWTYRYARDINVKMTRILVFIINLMGIIGFVAFVIQSQMIFFK